MDWYLLPLLLAALYWTWELAMMGREIRKARRHAFDTYKVAESTYFHIRRFEQEDQKFRAAVRDYMIRKDG